MDYVQLFAILAIYLTDICMIEKYIEILPAFRRPGNTIAGQFNQGRPLEILPVDRRPGNTIVRPSRTT